MHRTVEGSIKRVASAKIDQIGFTGLCQHGINEIVAIIGDSRCSQRREKCTPEQRDGVLIKIKITCGGKQGGIVVRRQYQRLFVFFSGGLYVRSLQTNRLFGAIEG